MSTETPKKTNPFLVVVKIMLLLATVPVVFTAFLVALELLSYDTYWHFAYNIMGNTGIVISVVGFSFSVLACFSAALLRHARTATLAVVLIFLDLLCVYMNICAFL